MWNWIYVVLLSISVWNQLLLLQCLLDLPRFIRKIKRERKKTKKTKLKSLRWNNFLEKIFKLSRFSCEIENMWSCQSVRGTSCRLCNASLISRNFDGLFTFILKKISIFIPEQLLLLLQLLRSFRTKIHKEWKWQMSGEDKIIYYSNLMVCNKRQQSFNHM